MMRKDQEAGTDKHTESNEGAEVARRLAKQWLNEGTELIPIRPWSARRRNAARNRAAGRS